MGPSMKPLAAHTQGIRRILRIRTRGGQLGIFPGNVLGIIIARVFVTSQSGRQPFSHIDCWPFPGRAIVLVCPLAASAPRRSLRGHRVALRQNASSRVGRGGATWATSPTSRSLIAPALAVFVRYVGVRLRPLFVNGSLTFMLRSPLFGWLTYRLRYRWPLLVCP